MRNKFLWIFLLSAFVYFQSGTKKYAVSKTYRRPIDTSKYFTDIMLVTIQMDYFNGLGRQIQVIDYTKGVDGNDVATHIEHDYFSRMVRDYLPYFSTTNSSNFYDNTEPLFESFYKLNLYKY